MQSFGNVLIFGDSYSTFEGHIPEGYATHYSPTATNTNVNNVEDTWWHQVISESGSNLVMNNSWSGSTVCYTGYGGYQPRQSFVFRAEEFFSNDKREKIDTVLILGGTNDSWNNSPVGGVQYSGWTDEDLKACLPAFCRILSIIRTSSPETRIINILNEDIIKKEICDGMKSACHHFGAECISVTGLEMTDSHPTKAGMIQIKEQLFAKIQ